MREPDGFLCLCYAVHEHGGRCPTGNQQLALADFSNCLYDELGLSHGVPGFSRRAIGGVAIDFFQIRKECG